MDPRVYFILPEHVSNAYNIWNCAWFLAQMSNLNEQSTSSTSLSKQIGLLSSDEANGTSNNTSSSSNTAKIENVCNLINTNNLSMLVENIFMNNANENILNELKNTNDFSKLNEPLLTILKIKKRNKASLFNLILPSTTSPCSSSTTLSSSSCSSSCSSLTSSTSSIPVNNSSSATPTSTNNNNSNNSKAENIKLSEIDKSTTPWLFLKSTDTNFGNSNNLNINDNNNHNLSNSDETDISNSNYVNEIINYTDESNNNDKTNTTETINQTNNEEQEFTTECEYSEGCKR